MLPQPNVIAVLFDFDDTLGEDTTSLFLKEKLVMTKSQIQKFWNEEVDSLVRSGWDPPLAYIELIAAKTEKTCRTYNELKSKRVVVAFHLTC